MERLISPALSGGKIRRLVGEAGSRKRRRVYPRKISPPKGRGDQLERVSRTAGCIGRGCGIGNFLFAFRLGGGDTGPAFELLQILFRNVSGENLDGLLMAEFHAAAELAKLVLGDTGHDGQTKLGVLVKGVDVVILEEHPYTGGQELPGVPDGVQGITGKTGNFLGNDQVEFPLAGIVYLRLKFSRLMVEIPDSPSSMYPGTKVHAGLRLMKSS